MLSILIRGILVLICLAAPAHAQQAGPTLYDVRLGNEGGKTRLVIESSKPVTVAVADRGLNSAVLFDPFHYKGKLPSAPKNSPVTGIEVNPVGGHITLTFSRPMRLAQKLNLNSLSRKNATRLVFDYEPAGTASAPMPAAMIDPAPKTGDGMLDPPKSLGQLRETRTVTKKTVSKTEPAKTVVTETPSSKTVVTTEPIPMPTKLDDVENIAPEPARKSDEPLSIVIDAGHGGKDPGARSPDGLLEKNITLAMARSLRDELNRRGHKATLTRDADFFIPLRERVNIGRRRKADLFISVHADSMGNGSRTTRGASVYTLSDVASDTESAKLAARENQADIIGGIDLSHEDKDVANILIDLAMRDTMNQSKKLANTLVGEFNQAGLAMLSPAHRFAGFAVLKAADVPSILIELGFLSNPSEANMLNDSGYRSRLARSIADTVDVYADKYRPRN